jgi:hypothetical protein
MFDGSGMSSYAELHADGQFGEAGYNLLFRLTRQELRRFPVLRHDPADDDAVWDVVGDFLVARGSGVSTMLLTRATDDDSFSALLRKSLRHWLVDQARKTDLGALRRRLERLIGEDDRFEIVPSGQAGAGWWRLTDTDADPSGPPLADLREAAWEVRDIRIPAWNSEGRRAPAADDESLGRIMQAVLARACGSLQPGTAVAVFADRLPNALDPAEDPLTEDEASRTTAVGSESGDPAETMIADERERDASRSARNFYTVMSVAERRLLPFLYGTISEQMGATGRGKSQTYEHVKALKERLRALLGEEDDEGRVLVLRELRRLCGSSADLAPDGDADVSSIRGSR